MRYLQDSGMTLQKMPAAQDNTVIRDAAGVRRQVGILLAASMCSARIKVHLRCVGGGGGCPWAAAAAALPTQRLATPAWMRAQNHERNRRRQRAGM